MRPLKGARIPACLHVTTETASLLQTLKAGGADVVICASNPHSTQDDVAASLVKYDKIPTFAIKGEDSKTYYKHIMSVLEIKPQMTMDDGADVVSVLHTKRKDLLAFVIGGTEETTTGVIRLRSMANTGVLQYPIIAVNDAQTKHFFDNRYGTGQSTMDGILRATNRLIAGSIFVVARLARGQMAITRIGHASFLIQFTDLNVLVDPNFANWLFLLKRIKRSGLRLEHLPPIDLVLLTHAHFDHFHKPTLRRLPHPKIGVMPWGVGDLAMNLGFSRIIELEWWESFAHRDWKVTLTPGKHWGARTLSDHHRGYGGFVLEHQGRSVYHAGDTAYFDGFKEIGAHLRPDIALLPIGAYHPETFRHVHMGPDEALHAFQDIRAQCLVPMHYGSFRLSFEEMDEPPRWLRQLADERGLSHKVRILDEGVPVVF